MGTALRWLGVVCLCVGGGCYEHHLRGEAGEDAGPDAGADVGVSIDAADDAPVDSGVDARDGQVEVDARVVDATVDAPVDAGCEARVPEDFPTLQDALDRSTCDRIIVTEDQRVSTVRVNRSVTITTSDRDPLHERHVIDGDGSGSVFELSADIEVTLERLVIQHGVAPFGAGIRSEAELTLRDVAVQDNRAIGNNAVAAQGGGGLGQMGDRPLVIEGQVVFQRNVVEGISVAGGGVFAGGDVAVNGRLALVDNHVSGASFAFGGGMYVVGTLTASGLTVARNTVTTGATSVQAPQGLAVGGGLQVGGDADLSDVSFDSNRAETTAIDGASLAASGGAFSCSWGRSVVLRGGTATNNEAVASVSGEAGRAQAVGGFISGGCDLQLEDMTIESNRVIANAGAGSVAIANGGAMECTYGRWRIDRTILRNNRVDVELSGVVPHVAGERSSARGGGLSATDCPVELTDVSVGDNRVQLRAADERGALALAGGGGLSFASEARSNLDGRVHVTLDRTSIVSNRVVAFGDRFPITGAGGGVFTDANTAFSPVITIASSTLADNSVVSSSNAGSAIARGGALASDSSADPPTEVEIVNATIANNDASAVDAAGGAFSVTGIDTANRIDVQQSIIWGNTLGSSGVPDDCSQPVLHGTRNLASDPGCFATSEVGNRNIDPGLQALTSINTYCQVLPITLSSPALNGGDPMACRSSSSGAAVDQCGRARVGVCDIGAVEATP